MFADQEYYEPFSFTTDSYFNSPVEAVLSPDLDFPIGDLPIWQDTTLLDDEQSSTLETPPLSRSSSLNSSDTQSPTLPPTTARPSTRKANSLELTWPADGQLNSIKPKLAKLQIHVGNIDSSVSLSTVSSPASSHPDPHHEGSCNRCRLTEAEARKCRLERRREQNRASQRKFRARKEAKIREAAGQVATLEQYVEFLEKHNNDLESTNADLQQRLAIFESTKRSHLTPSGSLVSPNHIQTLDWSLAVP